VNLTALKLTEKNFYRVFGNDAKMDGRLDLIQSSWKAFTDKNVHKFDLIISNPPYISTPDLKKLEKQVMIFVEKKRLN